MSRLDAVRRPFLLLFLSLAAFYLATSAGHVTSGDEDQTYLMIEALVERRSLAFTTFHQRVESYGVLQPLLALPFYLLGKLLALLAPPEYGPVIGRFTVTGLNAFVTAATATLLSLVARELGASTRGGVGLGLVFAVGTIAWPYARSFWAEPIGALGLTAALWCALRSKKGDPLVWWAAVGLLIGAAAATRVAWAVALPAFGLYLGVVGLWGRGSGPHPSPFGRLQALPGWWLWRAALGLGVGILAPAALALLTNVLRHGHPFDFGFGLARDPGAIVTALLDPAVLPSGAFGLLLSSGKGLFFYSPLVLGSVLALPLFLRRHPAEAILAAGVVGSFVATYGSYGLWPGNPGWGPRYLVPVVPFALLPLLAWMGGGATTPSPQPSPARGEGDAPTLSPARGEGPSVARAQPSALSTPHSALPIPHSALRTPHSLALAGLVGVSVSVQLLTLTTPFQAYLSATDWAWTGYDRILDADSPILGQARIFLARLQQYNGAPMPDPPHPARGASGEVTLGTGFREPDPPYALYRRPMENTAIASFASSAAGPVDLWLALQYDLDPGPSACPLDLRVDGQPRTLEGRWEEWHGSLRLVLAPLGSVTRGEHRLAISPCAGPGTAPGGREKAPGVVAVDLALYQDGQPFGHKARPYVPPIPVSTEEPWSRAAYGWFNDGQTPHLLDLWPWHVAHSGLSPWLAVAAAIPVLLALAWGIRLERTVGQRRDLTLLGAVGIGAAAGLVVIFVAASVLAPAAARRFPVGEPLAPEGVWRLHEHEARVLDLPGSDRLLIRAAYVDDVAPPITVHFRPAETEPWQHVAWLLPRDGSWAWRERPLTVQDTGSSSRQLSISSNGPAVLRPLEIGVAR